MHVYVYVQLGITVRYAHAHDSEQYPATLNWWQRVFNISKTLCFADRSGILWAHSRICVGKWQQAHKGVLPITQVLRQNAI